MNDFGSKIFAKASSKRVESKHRKKMKELDTYISDFKKKYTETIIFGELSEYYGLNPENKER